MAPQKTSARWAPRFGGPPVMVPREVANLAENVLGILERRPELLDAIGWGRDRHPQIAGARSAITGAVCGPVMWDLDDLGGVAEVAEAVGIERPGISAWQRRNAGAPAVLKNLSTGPVYSISQITAWRAGRAWVPPGARTMWDLDDIAGAGDLAEALGVARSTICAWPVRHKNFPAPLRKLAAGKLYSLSQVTAWRSFKQWVHGGPFSTWPASFRCAGCLAAAKQIEPPVSHDTCARAR